MRDDNNSSGVPSSSVKATGFMMSINLKSTPCSQSRDSDVRNKAFTLN